MTEMHFMVAVFERQGCKVNIESDLNGFTLFVENNTHDILAFEFNQKGEFEMLRPTPY